MKKNIGLVRIVSGLVAVAILSSFRASAQESTPPQTSSGSEPQVHFTLGGGVEFPIIENVSGADENSATIPSGWFASSHMVVDAPGGLQAGINFIYLNNEVSQPELGAFDGATIRGLTSSAGKMQSFWFGATAGFVTHDETRTRFFLYGEIGGIETFMPDVTVSSPGYPDQVFSADESSTVDLGFGVGLGLMFPSHVLLSADFLTKGPSNHIPYSFGPQEPGSRPVLVGTLSEPVSIALIRLGYTI